MKPDVTKILRLVCECKAKWTLRVKTRVKLLTGHFYVDDIIFMMNNTLDGMSLEG